MQFTYNPEVALAERYVVETGVSIFLTGKAGTGKTTFLHNIVETCHKRSVCHSAPICPMCPSW